MEKLLVDNHGIEALAILLCFNILATVGKFLFKFFDKKNDQSEQKHKSLSEKTQILSERMERLDGSMGHLQNVISSYMATTIDFASKLGGVEKQFMNAAENLMELERQIGKMSEFDNDMRKTMRAIKWLAGPDRWEELKETILKDEFES